jgi:hypothetical protein
MKHISFSPSFPIGLGLMTLIFAFEATAAIVPVCQRTTAIRDAIVKLTNRACEEVNEDDLAKIKRIAVPNRRIPALKTGDFSGLSGMEILNIKGNAFTELPEGLFTELHALKTLVLFRSKLTRLPDDFLEGLDNLENLHIFNSPFKTMSESVFVRLEGLRNLKVLDFNSALNSAEQARLQRFFPKSGKVQLNFY